MTSHELHRLLDSMHGVRLDVMIIREKTVIDCRAEMRVNFLAGIPSIEIESEALDSEIAKMDEEIEGKTEAETERDRAREELNSLTQKVDELLACVDKIKAGKADWIADADEALGELRLAVL